MLSAPCSDSVTWPSPEQGLRNLSSVSALGGEGSKVRVCVLLSTVPDTVTTL